MDNISKGLNSVSIKAAPKSGTLTNGMLLKKKINLKRLLKNHSINCWQNCPASARAAKLTLEC